jgi:hypothetical protein
LAAFLAICMTSLQRVSDRPGGDVAAPWSGDATTYEACDAPSPIGQLTPVPPRPQ